MSITSSLQAPHCSLTGKARKLACSAAAPHPHKAALCGDPGERGRLNSLDWRCGSEQACYGRFASVILRSAPLLLLSPQSCALRGPRGRGGCVGLARVRVGTNVRVLLRSEPRWLLRLGVLVCLRCSSFSSQAVRLCSGGTRRAVSVGWGSGSEQKYDASEDLLRSEFLNRFAVGVLRPTPVRGAAPIVPPASTVPARPGAGGHCIRSFKLPDRARRSSARASTCSTIWFTPSM